MALTMRRAAASRPAVCTRSRTVVVQASATKNLGLGAAAVAVSAALSLAGPALADLNAYEFEAGAFRDLLFVKHCTNGPRDGGQSSLRGREEPPAQKQTRAACVA